MKLVVPLTQAEISEAVGQWLLARNMRATGPVRVSVTRGDRPGDRDEATFEVDAEPVPAGQR